MNWKRIGRALVCLLVVFCLLLNMAPVQAQAVAVADDIAIGIVIDILCRKVQSFQVAFHGCYGCRIWALPAYSVFFCACLRGYFRSSSYLITQDYDCIFTCNLESFGGLCYTENFSVNITCNVNHLLTLLIFMVLLSVLEINYRPPKPFKKFGISIYSNCTNRKLTP